eukprot:TRINITY_DN1585_c0_g1_i1.p1 TRINITY_DN1585_c0_g1~~TRINITY_DN1585_c0_g1_i1.p1  ORF type:complete len:209 (+),score=34.37 TRINITY_DN1585_c0_g1_i1:160-786(+)
MTIISFDYVPPEPVAIEITQLPTNALLPPPRNHGIRFPLLIYTLHILGLFLGLAPIAIFYWTAFFAFDFVEIIYVGMIIGFQILFYLVRGLHALWYFKYGAHGFVRNKQNGEQGYEMVDATTFEKMSDVRRFPAVTVAEKDNYMVLYNPNRPADMLFLVNYRDTFFVQHGRLCVKRESTRYRLAVFVVAWLCLELVLLCLSRIIRLYL